MQKIKAEVLWVKGVAQGVLSSGSLAPSRESQKNLREGLRGPRTQNENYKLIRKKGKQEVLATL